MTYIISQDEDNRSFGIRFYNEDRTDIEDMEDWVSENDEGCVIFGETTYIVDDDGNYIVEDQGVLHSVTMEEIDDSQCDGSDLDNCRVIDWGIIFLEFSCEEYAMAFKIRWT